MAKSFHKVFVSGSTNRLPANMRPWKNLDDTFKTANQQQAKYAVTILEAAGFEVHEAQGDPKILDDFTDNEVEHMAEMEHGPLERRATPQRLALRQATRRRQQVPRLPRLLGRPRRRNKALRPRSRSSLPKNPRPSRPGGGAQGVAARRATRNREQA